MSKAKLLLLTALLTLVGCEHVGSASDNMPIGTVVFFLDDGTRCVSTKRGYSGGVTCDWEGAKEPPRL